MDEERRQRSKAIDIVAKFQGDLDSKEKRPPAILTLGSFGETNVILQTAYDHPDDTLTTFATIKALKQKPRDQAHVPPAVYPVYTKTPKPSSIRMHRISSKTAASDLDDKTKLYDAEINRMFKGVDPGIRPEAILAAVDLFRDWPDVRNVLRNYRHDGTSQQLNKLSRDVTVAASWEIPPTCRPNSERASATGRLSS